MRTRRPLAATLARSGLPGGIVSVMLLAVLLLGVVAMHAMSGSSTHHGSGHLVVSEAGAGHAVHASAPPGGELAGQVSDAVEPGAMCLVVLVTLLVVPPPRAALLTAGPGLAGGWVRHRRGPPRRRPAPDLRALGISRT